jgi:hypothetical protein
MAFRRPAGHEREPNPIIGPNRRREHRGMDALAASDPPDFQEARS